MAYTNCETTIGPDEVLCSQSHCNNYQQTSTMKRVCYCTDYKGNKIPGCDPKGDSFPVSTTECYNKATGERKNITPEKCDELRDKDKSWGNRTCYCCCSCFAWGTKVAVSANEVREIQEIGEGESVLTGSLLLDNGALNLSWEARPIIFSDGTSPKEGQICILVQYGDDGEIVVTTDQPFLMPDGTLKRADRLTVEDSLVDGSGNAVQIAAVYLGKANIGLHNIAAEVTGTSIDGHLLRTNGVVTGDHTVRVLQSSAEMAHYFAPGHDDLPVIGSAAYANGAGAAADQFHSLRAAAERPMRHAFVTMQEILTASVPFGAVPFVTPVQAADIRRNGTFRPISSSTNHAEFLYLEKLFRGFYPGIHFSLNWDDQDPNLYVFESFGIKVVNVSGALLRATCINRQGLALLMAHGIARFIGEPPGDLQGIACTGQADYFAIGYLFNDVFYGEATDWGLAALQQIGKLFGWISPAHAGGSNRCMEPSIRCRLDALNAAMAGHELPYCAGAPTIGTLKLEKAELRLFEGSPSVIATFSDPLLASSLGNVANYQIRPVTVVTAAEQDMRQLKELVLSVVLPDNLPGQYTLTVSNILAFDGSTLDPSHASATFDVP